MACEVEFIFDDRVEPPRSTHSILGDARFSQIILRRRRVVDILRAAADEGGCVGFHIIKTDEGAAQLARSIESKPAGSTVYFYLPSCLGVSRLEALPKVLAKARFALASTLLGPVHKSEASAILARDDAARILSELDADRRRRTFLTFADADHHMIDHLQLMDLRISAPLLRFVTGSTEARHFNSLEIKDGVLTKRSKDKEKMRAEHGYFHVLPPEMKRFAVPTFGFHETNDDAEYSMEYLVVPDLALQVVHDALSSSDFSLLMDCFFAFIRSRPAYPKTRAEVHETGRQQILGKMHNRLAAFRDMDSGAKLSALLNAAGPMGDLAEMEARSTQIIELALKQDPASALFLSHGDPCFSNILFDRRTGLFRLIDPRGAREPEDALMHGSYDLAKFSHSILGGYDSINNGLFHCVIGQSLNLEFQPDIVIRHAARDEFKRRLKSEGFSYFTIRAVELSLFMSMLPLHIDHPQKLLGFAMTACKIIDELESLAGSEPKVRGAP